MRILYLEICYEGSHLSLKNKSQTYTVEGVNSDFRHYIPDLRRCYKCFLGLKNGTFFSKAYISFVFLSYFLTLKIFLLLLIFDLNTSTLAFLLLKCILNL